MTTLNELMKQYKSFFVCSINGEELKIRHIENYRLDRVTVQLSKVDESCYSMTTNELGCPKLVIHDMDVFRDSTVDAYKVG